MGFSAATLIAFSIAATLLTITPGLDTALVLRTAAVEGARRAMLAGLGIAAGCLVWGCIVALGLGALLAASTAAYTVLRWAGAIYLFYLGARMLARPREAFDFASRRAGFGGGGNAFLRGFATNMLNPKIGVFYVSFLPQFIPAGANAAAASIALTAIHAIIGTLWFVLLIALTRPLSQVLRRPRVIGWLDRVTGGVFIAFGLRLALSPQR